MRYRQESVEPRGKTNTDRTETIPRAALLRALTKFLEKSTRTSQEPNG